MCVCIYHTQQLTQFSSWSCVKHPSIHSFIHSFMHPSIHSFILSFFHCAHNSETRGRPRAGSRDWPNPRTPAAGPRPIPQNPHQARGRQQAGQLPQVSPRTSLELWRSVRLHVHHALRKEGESRALAFSTTTRPSCTTERR